MHGRPELKSLLPLQQPDFELPRCVGTRRVAQSYERESCPQILLENPNPLGGVWCLLQMAGAISDYRARVIEKLKNIGHNAVDL